MSLPRVTDHALLRYLERACGIDRGNFVVTVLGKGQRTKKRASA